MRNFMESAQMLQSVLGLMDQTSNYSIRLATEWICRAVSRGSTIFTCGNGGSAADAAHMAEELVGRFNATRKPLKSVCLNSDAISMTCIANDFGWDEVFARQIRALGANGDVLVAFSTSGNSTNVVRAVREATACGLYCIHLGGESPGEVGRQVDIHIPVPSGSTARVQEVHTVILHHFLECIEDDL